MLPKIWSEHKQYRATFLPQGLSEHMWNLTQIGTSGEGSLHPATVGVEQFGATLHMEWNLDLNFTRYQQRVRVHVCRVGCSKMQKSQKILGNGWQSM